MKQLLVASFVMTAGWLSGISCYAQSATLPQPQIKENRQVTKSQQEVIAAITEMTEAFHEGDLDGVMSSYDSNVVVVFEPQAPVASRETIKKKFAEFFALKPRFEYGGHEVFVAGDTAIHIAPWTMSGVQPDGTPVNQSGLSVASLKRSDRGKWLIVIDDPHGSFLLQGLNRSK